MDVIFLSVKDVSIPKHDGCYIPKCDGWLVFLRVMDVSIPKCDGHYIPKCDGC